MPIGAFFRAFCDSLEVVQVQLIAARAREKMKVRTLPRGQPETGHDVTIAPGAESSSTCSCGNSWALSLCKYKHCIVMRCEAFVDVVLAAGIKFKEHLL